MEVFKSQTNIGLEKNLGLKKIMGPNKLWVPKSFKKSFGSQKVLKTILGLKKKFCVGKIAFGSENFGSEKCFGSGIFFESDKIAGQQISNMILPLKFGQNQVSNS